VTDFSPNFVADVAYVVVDRGSLLTWQFLIRPRFSVSSGPVRATIGPASSTRRRDRDYLAALPPPPFRPDRPGRADFHGVIANPGAVLRRGNRHCRSVDHRNRCTFAHGFAPRERSLVWHRTSSTRLCSARLLWQARISLAIGFLTVGLRSTIGIIVGAVAGYYGGGRLVETVYAHPPTCSCHPVPGHADPSSRPC